MKKENKKILKAVSEVAQEKEYQRLYEEAKPHFMDEWDAVCFELEHPSPEFIKALDELDNALANIDYENAEVIKIKL